MRAVRIAVLAAGLLIGLAVPAVASADDNGPVSCGPDLNSCATACRDQVGNPNVRLNDCVMTDGGWSCSACEYNSEN
ncbi:hypothetical protein [Nocardia sp. CDC160]|uniref:hypothetical protein n=1 Tax=Nocardia sp. CDC160 TaxID=3112166 RepID=UPI002DB96553|nr:hypothetical protein [Nocardia sp. CDC160]MEC3913153.1 hypothetical protein [Nocardia sp. CDC160]